MIKVKLCISMLWLIEISQFSLPNRVNLKWRISTLLCWYLNVKSNYVCTDFNYKLNKLNINWSKFSFQVFRFPGENTISQNWICNSYTPARLEGMYNILIQSKNYRQTKTNLYCSLCELPQNWQKSTIS